MQEVHKDRDGSIGVKGTIYEVGSILSAYLSSGIQLKSLAFGSKHFYAPSCLTVLIFSQYLKFCVF